MAMLMDVNASRTMYVPPCTTAVPRARNFPLPRVVSDSQGSRWRTWLVFAFRFIPWLSLRSCVDSYERRQEASRRVIGTLLGVKERAGLVEIRSGYPVPHNETEEEVRQLRCIES